MHYARILANVSGHAPGTKNPIPQVAATQRCYEKNTMRRRSRTDTAAILSSTPTASLRSKVHSQPEEPRGTEVSLGSLRLRDGLLTIHKFRHSPHRPSQEFAAAFVDGFSCTSSERSSTCYAATVN